MNEENYEVQCDACGWYGWTDDLINDRCPTCASDDIVDFEKSAETKPFTPGPWLIESRTGDGDQIVITDSDYERSICQLYDNWNRDYQDYEGNALLIAAAPDMFEALEATWEALDGLYGAAHGEPIPYDSLTADRQEAFNLALELVGNAIRKVRGEE